MARLSELYVWPNMNHVQCHVVARSEERNSGAYVTQTKLNTQIDSSDFSDPFNQRIDPSKTKIDSKSNELFTSCLEQLPLRWIRELEDISTDIL